MMKSRRLRENGDTRKLPGGVITRTSRHAGAGEVEYSVATRFHHPYLRDFDLPRLLPEERLPNSPNCLDTYVQGNMSDMQTQELTHEGFLELRLNLRLSRATTHADRQNIASLDPNGERRYGMSCTRNVGTSPAAS